MRIDDVIRKYNLQLDDEYVSPMMEALNNKDLRFKWTNIDCGHVLARYAKIYAKIGSDMFMDFTELYLLVRLSLILKL